MTLLEISDDLLALEAAIDAADGELTETIDVWLATLGAERDAKIDNYAALICDLEARAQFKTVYAERMRQLAASEATKAAALRERLHWFFGQHKIKRIDTARHRLFVQGNGGLVPLVIDGEVSPEYQKKEITIEPDKSKIRAALEAGIELPFARLGTRGSRLEIK